jgi:hypothetical protein
MTSKATYKMVRNDGAGAYEVGVSRVGGFRTREEARVAARQAASGQGTSSEPRRTSEQGAHGASRIDMEIDPKSPHRALVRQPDGHILDNLTAGGKR